MADAGIRAARSAAYENPRPEVARLVPGSARRVLDIGCASGALGGSLRSRAGVEVVGVERDPGYIATAEGRLDRVVRADLEELAGSPELRRDLGSFDCLIAADVLEHLRDPWSTLAAFGYLLEPGGTAIVSLPNVRYWETFWQLGVRGRWPRRLEGIFDRDHLRWFTPLDATELMAGAGLVLERVERVYRLRPSSPAWPPSARMLARTPLRPFFTFQVLLVARRPSR